MPDTYDQGRNSREVSVRVSMWELWVVLGRISLWFWFAFPWWNQSYGFSSSHVWMWDLDYKVSWALKSWCLWTVVLEKTLESPLDCKEIQSVNGKENQSWILIGRTKAEALILWPPDVKNPLIGKDPDDGKDWSQEEKETTEDEMIGWHHQLAGWVWANSGSWWWSGKLGILQSMALQRVGLSDWTELNWWLVILSIFSCTCWNSIYSDPLPIEKYIFICVHWVLVVACGI